MNRPQEKSLITRIEQSPFVRLHENLDAVNQILRYLKSKPGKGLPYSKYNNLNTVVFKIQIGLEDPLQGTAHLVEILSPGMARNMWLQNQVQKRNIQLWLMGCVNCYG